MNFMMKLTDNDEKEFTKNVLNLMKQYIAGTHKEELKKLIDKSIEDRKSKIEKILESYLTDKEEELEKYITNRIEELIFDFVNRKIDKIMPSKNDLRNLICDQVDIQATSGIKYSLTEMIKDIIKEEVTITLSKKE